MYEVKPKRFAHSISVGHMAETMALVYDVNPFYLSNQETCFEIIENRHDFFL